MKIKIVSMPTNSNRNASKWHADGGPLFNEFSNGITQINEGGTHEENPLGGTPVGVDNNNIPNLVEEGEVIYNDYVFSNRLIIPEGIRTKYNLRGKTFADAAKEIQKMSEEMPNDPIVKRTMDLRMNELIQEQEMVRQKKNTGNSFKLGGHKYLNESTLRKIGGIGEFAIPFAGNLTANIMNWAGYNDADLSLVEQRKTDINDAYTPIEAQTLDNYIEYNPYDISFGLNQLNASQAASLNNLRNTSGSNPAALRASMLTSDNSYMNQKGAEYRRALEYNDALRERVAAFNRGTDQTNAQFINAANQFNAQQAANRATALGETYRWEQALKDAEKARQAADLNALIETGMKGFKAVRDEGLFRTGQEMGVFINPETGTMMNIGPRFTEEQLKALREKYKDDPIMTEKISQLTPIKGALGGKINRKSKKRRLS